MGQKGTERDHTGPNGTIRDHTGPNGTIRDHTGPYGTIRDHTGPYGTIRGHTGPYETIQDHLGPYRTIRDHKEPIGNIFSVFLYEFSISRVSHATRNLKGHFSLHHFHFQLSDFTGCTNTGEYYYYNTQQESYNNILP